METPTIDKTSIGDTQTILVKVTATSGEVENACLPPSSESVAQIESQVLPPKSSSSDNASQKCPDVVAEILDSPGTNGPLNSLLETRATGSQGPEENLPTDTNVSPLSGCETHIPSTICQNRDSSDGQGNLKWPDFGEIHLGETTGSGSGSVSPSAQGDSEGAAMDLLLLEKSSQEQRTASSESESGSSKHFEVLERERGARDLYSGSPDTPLGCRARTPTELSSCSQETDDSDALLSELESELEGAQSSEPLRLTWDLQNGSRAGVRSVVFWHPLFPCFWLRLLLSACKICMVRCTLTYP